MKKLNILILLFVVVLGASCKKFLDINQNPNDATSSTPQLILPQAITASASQVVGYNQMGTSFVGYWANAGGFGGFGSSVTYEFSSSDNQARWGMYDVLEDYQQVLNMSEGDDNLIYFRAIARIMKAHGFQMLVDAYNSVPYSDALKGQGSLTPKYDDPIEIYKDLADQIDIAIGEINAGASATVAPKAVLTSQDPMFKGDMNMWKKFANTLKLRIMVTSNKKVTFKSTNFDPAGFLTSDAMVNPGYKRDAGKQNPMWNNWGFSSTGSDANKAWMPNEFVFAFYNKTKLNDPGRGAACYYQFPNTGKNRLGNEAQNVPSSPSGSNWYSSTNRTGATAGNSKGILKGPDMGVPIITASESYFLQAEAVNNGLISSSVSGGLSVDSLFRSGIKASFTYLYSKPDGSLDGDPNADFQNYLVLNDASPLVNFSLATTSEQKQEAIITQKYIALNSINSDQAWNDYRRTHYPTIVNTPGANGTQTFASTQSKSTRPDRLPTRILYPTSEGTYNPENVPKGINQYSSLIFWAMP